MAEFENLVVVAFCLKYNTIQGVSYHLNTDTIMPGSGVTFGQISSNYTSATENNPG